MDKNLFLLSKENFLKKEVSKFFYGKSPCFDFEDLYQEGFIGLSIAYERFDFQNSIYSFESYAKSWIKKFVLDFINQNNEIILPYSLRKKIKQYKIFIDEYWDKNSCWPDNHTICEHFLWNIETLSLILLYSEKNPHVQIEEESNEFKSNYNNDLLSKLNQIINNYLNQEDQELIKKRYGLNNINKMNYNTLSKQLNLPVKSIIKKEKKLLGDIRTLLNSTSSF